VYNVLSGFTDLNQESPTLDLTNDCFQFVIGFSEAINTSGPHIYHSALLLSPKTSIVQKLYGSQAHFGPTIFKMILQTPYRCSVRQSGWNPQAPIECGWIKLAHAANPRYFGARGHDKVLDYEGVGSSIFCRINVCWTPKTPQMYQFTPSSLSQIPGHGIKRLKVGSIPISH